LHQTKAEGKMRHREETKAGRKGVPKVALTSRTPGNREPQAEQQAAQQNVALLQDSATAMAEEEVPTPLSGGPLGGKPYAGSLHLISGLVPSSAPMRGSGIKDEQGPARSAAGARGCQQPPNPQRALLELPTDEGAQPQGSIDGLEAIQPIQASAGHNDNLDPAACMGSQALMLTHRRLAGER
jgi:hypothetical protein